MTIANSKIGVLYTAGLIAVACFPLFKVHWNSYAILFLGIIGIYNSFNSGARREQLWVNWIENKKLFWVSILFILPLVFSLGYSTNLKSGLKNIQHILPIVVFPLLFYFLLPRLNERRVNIFLCSFLVACIMHIIILHWQFYSLGLYDNFLGATFYKLPFREAVFNFRYESLHPSYISLWYCLAICITFRIIYNFGSVAIRVAGVFTIAVLLLTIVLLSSRIAFLCLVGLAIYSITLVKNRMVMVGLGAVFLILVLFSVTQISFVSSRVIDEFKQTEFGPPVGKKHNSVNIRIGIYKCAISLSKTNFLFGVGFGDVQDELDKCYEQYDTDVYLRDNYNSHSYFFHVLLGAGIFALAGLVYMFYFFLALAQKKKAYLYICFLLIIIIGMLFENTLSRNHGVLFFALFNSVFLSYYQINCNNANGGYSTLS